MKRESGEDRAKAFLKRRFGKKWYSIEPGLGATWGMPDGFVNIGAGRVAFIECKEALSDASFAYKLRPSQARVIPRMRREGALVTVLVGKPTHDMLFAIFDNDNVEYPVPEDATEVYLRALFNKMMWA